MKTKAVAYQRVSGQSQIDGDGFPRQSAAASKYAERNGLEIVDEYRDEGISGTSELAGRPGLAALLDRIESNGVRIVLVENATRLARDLFVQEVLLNEFRKLGVMIKPSPVHMIRPLIQPGTFGCTDWDWIPTG